jgi:hypothetical protein
MRYTKELLEAQCADTCASKQIEAEDLDWSNLEATEGQMEIEKAMDALILGDMSIFHAGVGSSSLAKKFSPRAKWITGCTVSENEKKLADSLALPGDIRFTSKTNMATGCIELSASVSTTSLSITI